MGFRSILVAYVVGGLTLPLLLMGAILAIAWFALPAVNQASASTADDEELEDVNASIQGAAQEGEHAPDAAAEGAFAVLREYNFPAAIQALNARNATTAANSAVGATDGSTDMGGGGGAGSESVYQSMYRSVFDRNKNANTASAVLANEDDGDSTRARPKKKAVGASVFYIVLRHGHLLLYDSAAQMDVRHVISLSHHSVALSDAPKPRDDDDDDDGDDKAPLKEADLFIKRTAIVLTPKSLPAGREQQQSAAKSQPRPFYLFSSTCSEKEDFYYALLTTKNPPPVARPIIAEDIIKLQSTLHASAMTAETRAFNAVVGRIFLAVHRTPILENLVRSKIEKKIARVQKPAFIASLDVKSIDLGNSAPVISNPRLRNINISGDTVVALDARYNGGVKVVISALAKLDLGPRFKTRTVDLVLAASLRRLQGHMSFRIKAPPSNRIWFCFDTMPDMEIKVEPVVSQRQITYAFILKAIEERIRAVVGETLVQPNWDDVPFFDTTGQAIRGGLWCEERSMPIDPADDGLGRAEALEAAKRMTAKSEKSVSMPSLLSAADDSGAAAASSGSQHPSTPLRSTAAASTDQANILKRRSAASLPSQDSPPDTSAGNRTPAPPSKPPRSPSFTSPAASTPSVALDDANVEPVRSDDVALQPRRWRPRASLPSQTRREAVAAVREMHERVRGSEPKATDQQPADGQLSDADDAKSEGDGTPSRTSPIASPFPSPVPDEPRRTDSGWSSGGSVGSSASSKTTQQRKTILAATAAATNAARNWSWNAIANRTGKGRGDGLRRQPSPGAMNGSRASVQGPVAWQEPIGRGQPLPPPGTPLPGPHKTLWQAAANGLGGVGKGVASVRRKPVLPPRSTTTQQASRSAASDRTSSQSSVHGDVGYKAQVNTPHDVHDEAERSTEDEFGPWRENSGNVSDAATRPPDLDDVADALESGHQDTPVVALPAESGLNDPSAATLADEISHDDRSEGKAERPKKTPPPLPARRQAEIKPAKSAEAMSRDDMQSASEKRAEASGNAGVREMTTVDSGLLDEPADLSGKSSGDVLRDLVQGEKRVVDGDVADGSEHNERSSRAPPSAASGAADVMGVGLSREGSEKRGERGVQAVEESVDGPDRFERSGGEGLGSSGHARVS